MTHRGVPAAPAAAAPETGPVEPSPLTGRLPYAATSFVGRRRQLADIRERLAASRLVTLVGPGGVGKTRLAVRAAGELERLFRDGTFFVELGSVTTEDTVANAVVHALGVTDQSYREPLIKVVDHLYDRELLLVLDNCEHVLAGCIQVADRILRSAPAVRILATSRTALGMTGEARYPVPPLTIPESGGPETPDSVGQYESSRLLVDRAEAAVPGFRLTDANVDSVVRLCAQLEGLPLAIELAVARLRTLSLDQIVGRLSDRFGLLTTGNSAAEPRQQTLRSLIDWSYALCTPAERQLWARLSVFAGGFDLEAVEGICGDSDEPVLDLLGSLVDQSVVTTEGDGTGGVRFRMLETIREYGAERLDHSGQTHELVVRHRRHYLGWARRVAAGWCGSGQEEMVRRMRLETDNLRAVMDGCAQDGADGDAVELVGALRYRWYADGYIAQGRRWADEVLDRPGRASPERATALWVSAWVCLLQGEHQVARRRLAECEAIATEQCEPVALAYITKLRGLAAMFSGDLEAACEHYDHALSELWAVGDFSGLLAASFQFALALSLDERFDEAQRISEQALAVSEHRGERWARSYIQWVRGVHCWLRGDHLQADALGRRALDLHRVFKLSVGTALMTELLAWTAWSTGDEERAAELLGGADALWARAGTGIAAFGPHLLSHHARCDDALRRSADRRGLRDARERGAVRDGDEIIAFALAETPCTVSRQTDRSIGALTPRQRQIAELIAEGLSNRDIAGRLVLSVRTVESHVEHILTRLGFSARTQVASWVASQQAAAT